MIKREYILVLLPIILLGIYWFARPFPDRIAFAAQSLSSLSYAQRANILLASKSVDGIVIKPGETFSFNKVVGPRTEGKGYCLAPSYLGPESPNTLGGGICLLSSVLYQAALTADLKIVERWAHLRTIKTVPPGLDATVWYGGANLCFKNTLTQPVEINANVTEDELAIQIMGERNATAGQPATLITSVRRESPDALQVDVFKASRCGVALVSRDLYRLAP